MADFSRRIDHLALAVHDLEAAADFYRRLGLQVGARNRHPWGTENRLAQFRSSFLELITVGDDPSQIQPHAPGRFSFGGFVRDYLERREGLAMFVLDSADAEADAAHFAAKGVSSFEPFFFERKGRRPNGSETHVAFTLAFAFDDAIPDASFFVCQQHFPENFWNAELQKHPNGASSVSAVTLGVAEPKAHTAFLSAFTGVPASEDGATFRLQNGGALRVEKSAANGFVSFSVAVPDLARQAAILNEAGVAHEETSDGLIVKNAFGVNIVFAPAEPR